jgi:hypothetical protein
MDEIKFNLNKLPEFPKSIRNGGTQDIPLGEEEKKSIIKFMKAADQANTGNKDGLISSSELILYGTNNRSPESWQSSLVFNEWKKQSAQEEKPQGAPPDRNSTQERNQTVIEKTLEELGIEERNQQEILNKKQQELNKSASDVARATKDAKIELTSSATDSRGYVNANGQIGEYKFKYTNLNSDTSPAKLTLTDSSGKKVELENPEKYKELEPFLKKLESAVKNNPDNEHIVVRYSCQFSSRFQ